MNDIFINKWDYLEQDEYSYFLARLAFELKERNQMWIGKVVDIIELSQAIAALQVEKGVRKIRDLIRQCLSGDLSFLSSLK